MYVTYSKRRKCMYTKEFSNYFVCFLGLTSFLLNCFLWLFFIVAVSHMNMLQLHENKSENKNYNLCKWECKSFHMKFNGAMSKKTFLENIKVAHCVIVSWRLKVVLTMIYLSLCVIGWNTHYEIIELFR